MNNEDISNIFEKLNIDSSTISPDMVTNFLNMLGNSKKDESDASEISTDNTSHSQQEFNPNEFNTSNPGIDINMLLKMKSMIDKMNVTDDTRSNLLGSLRPYLKESRQNKLDQYIQLMNMSKMIDFLPFMGGGSKKDEQ